MQVPNVGQLPNTLSHVTTTTGERRISRRAQVPEWHILQTAQWMDRSPECSVPGEPVPVRVATVAQRPDFEMRFRAFKATLHAELHHREFGHSLTLAVAADETGDASWRHLSDGLRPSIPWCAVAPELGLLVPMLFAPSEIDFLMDFESRVAWGWLHLVHTQGGFAQPTTAVEEHHGR